MNIGMLYYGREKGLTGINRFSYEILKELLNKDSINKYFPLRKNYFDLNKDVQNLIALETKKVSTENVEAYLRDVDIVYSFYSAINKMSHKAKYVMTVHDLIPLVHPEFVKGSSAVEFFDKDIRESCKKADVVAVDSEFTKKDVLEQYGVSPDKVRVIYPGLGTDLNFEIKTRTIIDKHKLHDGYIFSVSTMHPRKNMQGLVNAFIKFKQSHKNDKTKLVLVGKPGWMMEEFDSFMKGLGSFSNDVVLTGYVSNDELSELYVNALAVAYVSLYEGFGLPILEGMAAGKMVISSNTSSMPEVGGDTVQYCDPYSIDSIEYAIEQAVCNESLRNELGAKAKTRSSMFSYSKAAEQLLDIFNSLK